MLRVRHGHDLIRDVFVGKLSERLSVALLVGVIYRVGMGGENFYGGVRTHLVLGAELFVFITVDGPNLDDAISILS